MSIIALCTNSNFVEQWWKTVVAAIFDPFVLVHLIYIQSPCMHPTLQIVAISAVFP